MGWRNLRQKLFQNFFNIMFLSRFGVYLMPFPRFFCDVAASALMTPFRETFSGAF